MIRHHYIVVIIVIAFMMLSNTVTASPANAITVNSIEQFPISLSPYISIFADNSQGLLINDIKDIQEEQWQQGFTGTANFGFTDSAYWVRVRFNNTATVPQHVKLEQAYPLMDEVTFFAPQISQETPNLITYSSFQTGDSFPFESRGILHRNFIFNITVPPETLQTYYVRFHSRDTIEINFKLWDELSFSTFDHNAQLMYGIFYGAIFVLIVFNLSIYFALQYQSYLYYVATLIAFTLVEASLNGLTFEYLFSNNPEFNKLIRPILICVVMGLTGLFSISYFTAVPQFDIKKA